jgi:PAS domain S-box-containing protein
MKPSSETRRILLFIVLLNVLLNAVIAALTGYYILRERDHYLDTARITTSNLAHLLRENVMGRITAADLVLQSSADGYVRLKRQKNPGNSEIEAYLEQHKSRIEDLDLLRIADEKGNVRGDIVPGTDLNIADRDFYVAAKNRLASTLIISKPHIGRVSGQVTIYLARRLNNEDGSFAGIVYAGYRLKNLGKMFGQLDVGSKGVFVLLDKEMAFLAVFPDRPGSDAKIGKKTLSAELRTLIEGGADSGIAEVLVSPDKQGRITSFIRLTPLPMILIVGVTNEDFLAPWHREVGLIAGGFLIFMLVSGLLSWFGLREVKKRGMMKEQLLEAKRFVEQIINSAQEGVVVCDLDLRFLLWNPFMEQMVGMTASEVLGRHPSELFPFLQAAGMVERMEKVLSGESPLALEFPYLVPGTGKTGWVSDLTFPLFDSKGKIAGIISTVRDVTASKQIENDLRINKNSFNLIAETVGEVFWLTDNNIENTTYISPAYEQVWGRSTASLYDNPKSFMEAIHPEDRERVIAYLEVQKELQPFSHEYRIIRPNGEIRWIFDRGFPVKDESGQVTQYAGVAQDITESKQVEEILHAKNAAESANHAKSEFLANMSHELRTPMNGVIGMAELLKMTDLTEEQMGYVEALDLSGNNLLSLINDVLDLSKIEAGKIDLEQAEFSLHRCINDVIQTQKSVIHKKGLSLDLEIAREIPSLLLGDKLRLKQIILNLLGNATKFTAQGGITISAQVLEQHDSSVLVQIAVRDTGIGVSAEVLGDIFQPFIQADRSTTRQFGGTGLGLSISRRLAELMNGSISVESTLGVGSCFNVTLPFLAARNDVTEDESTDTTVVNWNEVPLRVLFVEDNPVNTKFGTTLLRKLGHDVVSVENGLECLVALKNSTFDLVLMDIQMPIMNGETALREIRRKEQGTSFHQMVIAVTAYALRGDNERFLREGFDGYVLKPFKANALISEMKRVRADIASNS